MTYSSYASPVDRYKRRLAEENDSLVDRCCWVIKYLEYHGNLMMIKTISSLSVHEVNA